MISTLVFGFFYAILFPVSYSLDGDPKPSEEPRGALYRYSKMSFANFVKHPSHHLDVNPIASSSVTRLMECAFACVGSVPCFSFNVAAQPGIDGLTQCELLSTDKYNASDKFKANSLYHHHSIFSPCAENPCKNGGKCMALYCIGDYRCKGCFSAFHGKRCELPAAYYTLGCFKDEPDRAIPILEGLDPLLDGDYTSRQNATHKCYEAALKRGYKVFGVQDGGQCFSGPDAQQTYHKHGASDACKSDGEGGPWANQVYQIKASDPDYQR